MEGYLTISRSNAWIAGLCLLSAIELGFAWPYIGLAVAAAAGLVAVYFLLRNPFWAFLVFMFSLPFWTLRLTPITGFSNPALMAIAVLFLSMLLNLRKLPPLRLRMLGAKPWLMVAFICVAMLGTLFPSEQSIALKWTVMAITLFSVYLAGTLLLTSPDRWYQAVYSFLLGALASALAVLYDFFLVYHPSFYRAGSFFTGGRGVAIATIFLLALPLALSLLEKERRWYMRTFLYSVALCSIATVLFSATRSAWLALAVLAVIELLRHPLRALVGIGLIVLLMVGLVRAYLPSTYEQYAIRVYSALNPEYGPQGQIAFRIENYGVALRMLASYPVLGVGMNNFAAHAGRYGRATIPVDMRLNTHNAFLEILTGTGLLGGIAYILVWLLTFYEFMFVASRGPPSMRPLALGLALGFLMFIIDSMFHSSHVAWLLAPIFAFGSTMRRHMLGSRTRSADT